MKEKNLTVSFVNHLCINFQLIIQSLTRFFNILHTQFWQQKFNLNSNISHKKINQNRKFIFSILINQIHLNCLALKIDIELKITKIFLVITVFNAYLAKV